MSSLRYAGRRIAVSKAAALELIRYDHTLFEVVAVLEYGVDAPRKRKSGTIERWLDKGNKTYNAVVAANYDEIAGEEVWVLIHYGQFTRRKRK